MKIPIKKFRIVSQNGYYYIKTWAIYWPFWMFIWSHGEGSCRMFFESHEAAMRYLHTLQEIKKAEKSPYVTVDEFHG